MSEFEDLQRLLLGEKKSVLDALETSPDRARLVAEVLAHAIGKANTPDGRLVRALQDPVAQCISHSVRKDSATFADALYPAMAPAIRKSISETLRQFVQSLNQVIEHSVSVKGMRWRWEAWRSGVPFAEIVLKNTLLYRVEESYLIHRVSGLLVEHVTINQSAGSIDEDAVSAMLTAIQDFVNDAFSSGQESDLETLDMGERSLWVIRGSQAIMACMVRGIPPRTLRDRLMVILDEIHDRYSEQLEHFSGDRGELLDVAVLLNDTLTEEAKPTSGKGQPWPAILLLGGLVGAAVFAGLQLNDDTQMLREQALLHLLEEEPGLVLLGSQRSKGRLNIQGLRDPMARDPMDIAEKAGYSNNELELQFSAFQSLDASLVLERVRQMLHAPDSVNIDFANGVLQISGQATPEWVDRIRAGIVPSAGIESLDSSALRDDQAIMLKQVQEALHIPEGVEVTLDGRSIIIEGAAPLSWHKVLDKRLKDIDWLQFCDGQALQIVEWQKLQELINAIGTLNLTFSEGVALDKASAAGIARLITQLDEAQQLSMLLGGSLNIILKGYSDGTGNQGRNIWLRHQRVDAVKKRLEVGGVSMDKVHSGISLDISTTTVPDLARRKVTIKVSVSAAPLLPSGLCR